MKKVLKMSGKIAVYVFIYFFSQICSSSGIGIFYVIKYHNTKTTLQLQDMLTNNMYMITLLGVIMSLIIYSLLLRKKDKSLWQRCEFKKVDLKNVSLIICAALSISFMTCSFVLISQNTFKSYEEVSKTISTATQTIFPLIIVIIVVPIFEEILFRGLIFNELRKNVNIIVSVVVQALIFALVHGNSMQVIYTFIFGAIAAIVYIWTKSILSNILLHICFNLMATLIVPPIVENTSGFVYLYLGIGAIILSGTLVLLYKHTHKNKKLSTIYEVSN